MQSERKWKLLEIEVWTKQLVRGGRLEGKEEGTVKEAMCVLLQRWEGDKGVGSRGTEGDKICWQPTHFLPTVSLTWLKYNQHSILKDSPFS